MDVGEKDIHKENGVRRFIINGEFFIWYTKCYVYFKTKILEVVFNYTL